MTSVRRLEERLEAWKNFRGIARATRTLAAAQALRWNEDLHRVQTFVRWAKSLRAAYPEPDLPPTAPSIVIAVGTDLGLCGPLNTRVAELARPLFASADLAIVVGRRLRTLLSRPRVPTLAAPSSFGAVEAAAAEITALVAPFPLDRSRLTIVVTTSVEPDGRPNAGALHHADVDAPKLPDLVAELSEPDEIRSTAATLLRHARIVAALTRGATSEAEARWRTMNRAHDAADRRITEQDLALRRLRQELVTQEMLEARRGAKAS